MQIELMVTVAIVGILASIAVPSYKAYITKGKRGEAEAALVTFANAMEQWRLQNGSYCGAAVLTCTTALLTPTCTAAATVASPTIFSTVVPISGGTPTYNLYISTVTTNAYMLTAKPTGTQTGDGNLCIDNTGAKSCGIASSCLNGTSW